MPGSNRSANASLPKRCDNAAQPDTAPGIVTVSQPVRGIVAMPLKRSGDQPAGARPEALRPCSRRVAGSHRMQNRSLPSPLLHGSVIVSAIAAASAASTALPPLASMERPACVASGCDVLTTLRASTGCRFEV